MERSLLYKHLCTSIRVRTIFVLQNHITIILLHSGCGGYSQYLVVVHSFPHSWIHWNLGWPHHLHESQSSCWFLEVIVLHNALRLGLDLDLWLKQKGMGNRVNERTCLFTNIYFVTKYPGQHPEVNDRTNFQWPQGLECLGFARFKHTTSSGKTFYQLFSRTHFAKPLEVYKKS